MLADALSKKTAPKELLQNVLSVGRLELHFKTRHRTGAKLLLMHY